MTSDTDIEMLTNTERRIFEFMSDDLPHTRAELATCLPDELSAPTAVRGHLTNLRKKLSPRGYLILCVMGYKRELAYRMVRRLRPSHE